MMDPSECTRFADRVAKLCCEQYNRLPKKGKPQQHKEWTLMAAVVSSMLPSGRGPDEIRSGLIPTRDVYDFRF